MRGWRCGLTQLTLLNFSMECYTKVKRTLYEPRDKIIKNTKKQSIFLVMFLQFGTLESALGPSVKCVCGCVKRTQEIGFLVAIFIPLFLGVVKRGPCTF